MGRRPDDHRPVLTVPYRRYYRDEKNVTSMSIEHAYFLPHSLAIDGVIMPEKRSRGLYEVILYRIEEIEELSIICRFSVPDFSRLRIPEKDILREDACITVEIPDTRGIQRRASLAWNRKAIPFLPGVRGSGLYRSGIHAFIRDIRSGGRSFDFAMKLSIQGISSLSFAPPGQETTVRLRSSWPHPSFTGAYLPSTRKITKKGFEAGWKVSYFGRNFPQEFTDDKEVKPADTAFGVALYQPVDFYQKCVRAVKYGFLSISLTFLCFFLFEVFMGLKIHPLQYLMVWSALCLFYLLFLSLSEYMNFIVSCLAASAGVIAMITGYSVKVLKTRKRGGIMAGLLTALYAYLFLLVQNEDYTLLLGSVALFVILGVVMHITRNIDWHKVRLNPQAQAAIQDHPSR
ncbi:MAG TPA: cell envelope integrity protein CreD [Spirochaetota bacterium]|nr:cell envelope integrity protein CreD [Spirochaetota bacterium]